MTAAAEAEAARWLTVGEACRLLGVDPSTLRAWTDAGQLPSFRTPGGHRRYRREDLEAFLARRRRRRSLREVVGTQAARLLPGSSRRQIRRQMWYAQVGPEGAERLRQICRTLMGALAGYLAGGRRQGRALREGEAAGRALGLEVAARGLSPLDAAQAFLFFKEAIVESVATRVPAAAEEKVAALRRIDAFLDRVLVEVMAAYGRAPA
ncbi:MAG: helix-turn-helix domain-containing protein [Armatimonadota bacterium]|nr:helix-turn-helix domain-containing protein [Armatimonadota bacterium]MDR7437579.1 helix-turn-helix domain-containing protein [Armatimonadota bacterium]MDR7472173.1 helix-turn-helix domain-containing protein [Armatimonadota bacterium]MDR7507082.1 helix-turn-helix domain-containing protein [Armatimonadota bacterium]MDR7508713.1 helix-turn-helix domain-containing protein [Armatimonadota bacterium]